METTDPEGLDLEKETGHLDKIKTELMCGMGPGRLPARSQLAAGTAALVVRTSH